MLFNIKKFIGYSFNDLLRSKKLNTYVLFFFISLAFWFLTMLSKTHETTFRVPLKYINYPEDLMELTKPESFVNVRVKASGISIITYHMFNYKSLILNYNIANSQPIDNGKNLFWIMNSKRKEIVDVLGTSIEIMNVNPSRVVVSFVKKNKKEVPVLLNLDISLKQAFWLANDVKLLPNSVVLYGSQHLLDSVNNIETDVLMLNDLDEDQTKEVNIVIPNGLRCKTKSVLVEINIEPFIEEVLINQVEIRNLIKGYSMKLFPRDVSVTVRLPKNKYQLLETNFIKLYVDASEIEEQHTIQIRYDNLPTGVKIQRIYPNQLEFLLIKE
tara:strand:- start:1339 stop:2319 length:981 start_codon:yes stop_codon:yes gene_type:complete